VKKSVKKSAAAAVAVTPKVAESQAADVRKEVVAEPAETQNEASIEALELAQAPKTTVKDGNEDCEAKAD